MEHKSLGSRLLSGSLSAMIAVMSLSGSITADAAKQKFKQTLQSATFSCKPLIAAGAPSSAPKITCSDAYNPSLQDDLIVTDAHWVSDTDPTWTMGDDFVAGEDYNIVFTVSLDAHTDSGYFNDIDEDAVFTWSDGPVECTILSSETLIDPETTYVTGYVLQLEPQMIYTAVDQAPQKVKDLDFVYRYREGEDLTLRFEAYGADVKYQWYEYDIATFENKGEIGEPNTTGELTLTGLTDDDSARAFFCKAYNNFGSVTSTSGLGIISSWMHLDGVEPIVDVNISRFTAGSSYSDSSVSVTANGSMNLVPVKYEVINKETPDVPLKDGDTILGSSDYTARVYLGYPDSVDPEDDPALLTEAKLNGVMTPFTESHATSEGLGYNYVLEYDFSVDDVIVETYSGILRFEISLSRGEAYVSELMTPADEDCHYSEYTYSLLLANLGINGKVTYSGKDYPVVGVKDGVFKDVEGINTVEFCNVIRKDAETGEITILAENQLRFIGDHAFEGCPNLTTVVFDSPTKLESIGKDAFNECVNLENIGWINEDGNYMLPSTLKEIKDFAFRQCYGLTKIWINDEDDSSQFETIGPDAFIGCKNLVGVGYSYIDGDLVMPSSVKTIGKAAFSGCTALKQVEFWGNSQLETIGDEAFEDCTNLQFFGYANSGWFMPANVKTIGSHAFENTRLYIAETDWLSRADKLETIGACAFGGCTSIRKLILPESVTEIGSSAFSGSGLLNLTICGTPKIDGYIVANCEYLKELTLSGLSTYDQKALSHLTNELNLTILDGTNSSFAEAVKYSNVCNKHVRFAVSPASETGTVEICDELFSEQPTVLSVDFGGVVSKVGYNAFKGTSITEVTLPEYTDADGNALPAELGIGAFRDCELLTDVHMPDSYKVIPDLLFANAVKLETVNSNAQLISIGDQAFYNAYCMKGFTIPDTVQNIGSQAFVCCYYLESSIPSSLVSVGDYAFQNCSRITSAELSDNVSFVGNGVFSTCRRLETARLPFGLESVPDEIFSGCDALVSVELPASITAINSKAFSGCKALESIEIPDNVKNIGKDAFNGCIVLETVKLPESLSIISDHAFDGCVSLSNITIPKGTWSFGEGAFANCTSLSIIDVPESVGAVGKEAFASGSSSVKRTIIIRNPDTIFEDGFVTKDGNGGTEWNIDLYVVEGGKSDEYVDTKNIPHKHLKNISSYIIRFKDDVSSFKATGTEIEPEITVESQSGIELEKDQYTVNYSNNIEAGEAYVAVTGIGFCVGTVIDTFTIEYNCELGDHLWGEWEVTNEPTCHSKGTKTRVCTVCGEIQTQALPMTEHVLGEWVQVSDPTCTEPGVLERHCTDPECSYFETDTVPVDPESHDWSSWGTSAPATCTEEGKEVRSCTLCGKTEIRVIPATGHEFGEWTVQTPATCTDEGLEYRTCLHSGCTEIEEHILLPTGHTWSGWTIDSSPTCTKAGRKVRICSVCGEFTFSEIPAIGHNYEFAGHVDEESVSYDLYVCSNCGDEKHENEVTVTVTTTSVTTTSSVTTTTTTAAPTTTSKSAPATTTSKAASTTTTSTAAPATTTSTAAPATTSTATQTTVQTTTVTETTTTVTTAPAKAPITIDFRIPGKTLSLTASEGGNVFAVGDITGVAEADLINSSGTNLIWISRGSKVTIQLSDGTYQLTDKQSGVTYAFCINDGAVFSTGTPSGDGYIIGTEDGEIYIAVDPALTSTTVATTTAAPATTTTTAAPATTTTTAAPATTTTTTAPATTTTAKATSTTTSTQSATTTKSATQTTSTAKATSTTTATQSATTTKSATQTTSTAKATSTTTATQSATTTKSATQTTSTAKATSTTTATQSATTTKSATQTTSTAKATSTTTATQSATTTKSATQTTSTAKATSTTTATQSATTTKSATQTTSTAKATSTTTVTVTAPQTASATQSVTASQSSTSTAEATATSSSTVTGTTPIETTPAEDKFGDINGDGMIDGVDASLILVYNASHADGVETLTPEQLALADINGDGLVDSVDASLILVFNAMSVEDPDLTLDQFLLKLKKESEEEPPV